MVSVPQQAGVIFRKNLTLNIRSKEFQVELILPIVSAAFTITAKYVTGLSFAAALYLPVSLSGFLRSFVFNFINEKAMKYKETQKIMGLKSISYNLGWLAYNYLKAFICGAAFMIPCLIVGAFNTDQPGSLNIGQMILAYALFIFAALNQCYMYTTFFSTPKLPSELITLVQFIASAMQYVAAINYVQSSSGLLTLISLLPQSALSFIFLGSGWTAGNYIDYSTLGQNYSYWKGITMLIVDGIVYFILYLYFDQVIQNEYGTQKDKLFFINWIWKSKNKKANSSYNELEDELSQENLDAEKGSLNSEASDDYCSARYKEPFDNPQNLSKTIKVRDLVKRFGNFVAVDNLSVTLYEQQIFCLLGHNGAGKSTTISLLTGLLKKDRGTVEMCGYNIDNGLDEARQNIGLCQQMDVLYDHFTVEENLRFIGEIKGRSLAQIEEESRYLIEKCQLSNEVGKTAKILSGGNKRKLSLAMALIGESKIVFLDEPSSGLDFNARREIKEILLELKREKRTVILTTHHLEEAEEVADRIAIMARGQLLTLGTNDFIKRNFGVGYHLTISKKPDILFQRASREQSNNNSSQNQSVLSTEKVQWVRETVERIIPTAKFNPQKAIGIVQYTLAFQSKSEFSNLFKILESDQGLSLDLEMNTLEDAFINIGMDEEKYLNPGENIVKNNHYTGFNDSQFSFAFFYINVPECLKLAPVYDFKSQLYACILRKYFITVRSMSVFISFFLPMVLQLAGVMIAKYAITSVDSDDDDPDQRLSIQMLQIIVFSIFGLIAYIFVMTNFAGVPVMERELKLKYSLNVMGCRSFPYWFGTFIFDFVFISINMYIFFIICFIINFDAITDNFGSFFLLTQTFIFSIISISYFISFLFDKAQTCYKSVFFLCYILFYMVPAIISSQSKAVQAILTAFSPFMSYSGALSIVAVSSLPPGSTFITSNYPSWQQKPYQYVMMMLGQGVFYMILAMRAERRKETFQKEPIANYSESDRQSHSEEVAREDVRVSNPNCPDKIKVAHLYKTYHTKGQQPYTAIKNNSFGVQNGEILGLLGPNGAGKSTTFNILTAFLAKSQGSVKLKNIEVEGGLMEIFQDVGICPQFNNIYDNMTVLEHLRMFGRMKGLIGENLTQSIEYFLSVMQLGDYRNRQAGKLSGGNKRKLCVTIALIGGPDMQFFDEPSSGVDPIARRFLWNTLSQSLKLRKGAIVLTTHSMEEAESLCSKIGILINGKFMCYGSPQFLKEKYGDGYKVSFKTDINNKEQVIRDIQAKFVNAQLLQTSLENENIAFIFPYQGFSLNETFDYFENQLTTQRKENRELPNVS